jgi:hypothetical protein
MRVVRRCSGGYFFRAEQADSGPGPGRQICQELARGAAVFVEVGSAQTTKNGDLFVSWGGLSYLSEFSPSGKLLFNARLPIGTGTYRAYRLPWNPGS